MFGTKITPVIFVTGSESLLLYGGRAFLSIQDAVSFSFCILSCLCCQASLHVEESTNVSWAQCPALFQKLSIHLGCSFSCKLGACVLSFGRVLFRYPGMFCILGLSLQDEVGVCSLPNQCSHTGQWLTCGDPKLLGREVHPKSADEAR